MSAETDELIKRINIFFPEELRAEYLAMVTGLRDLIREKDAEIERLKQTCHELTDAFNVRVQSEAHLIVEATAGVQAENERLKARISELEDFVSECRYAGPGGLERIKQEAVKLFAARKAAQ